MRSIIEANEPNHVFIVTAGIGHWMQAIVDREGMVHIHQQSDKHPVRLSNQQAYEFAEWLLTATPY